jgi:hypothetical protein
MRHMEQRLRDAEAAREEAADADVAGSLPLLRQVEAMSTAAATHRAGAAQVSRVMQHMSSILKPHETSLRRSTRKSCRSKVFFLHANRRFHIDTWRRNI